jgi:hypothetical protein
MSPGHTLHDERRRTDMSRALNWSPKVGLVGKSLGCEGLSAVLHRAQAFELC